MHRLSGSSGRAVVRSDVLQKLNKTLGYQWSNIFVPHGSTVQVNNHKTAVKEVVDVGTSF